MLRCAALRLIPADSAGAPSFVTPGPLESDRARYSSPRSPTSSSSTSSTNHITVIQPDDDEKEHTVLMAEPMLDRRPSQQAVERAADHKALQIRRQPYMTPVIKSGAFMRGIAAEARAWSARALVGGANRDDVDPVSMLLPEAAKGQRVGGPAGRGPLLRRLQTVVYGELPAKDGVGFGFVRKSSGGYIIMRLPYRCGSERKKSYAGLRHGGNYDTRLTHIFQ